MFWKTRRTIPPHTVILTCLHCGLSVNPSQSGIERHARGHEGKGHDEKGYKCDLCGFWSAAPNHQSFHKRFIKRNPPLSCEHCSFRCVSQDVMDAHLEFSNHDAEQSESSSKSSEAPKLPDEDADTSDSSGTPTPDEDADTSDSSGKQTPDEDADTSESSGTQTPDEDADDVLAEPQSYGHAVTNVGLKFKKDAIHSHASKKGLTICNQSPPLSAKASRKRATYKERGNPADVAGIAWLSASCVTVSGFLPDLLGDVLLKFSKVGEIIEFKSEHKKNCVHVRFGRTSEARSALKHNATFLNDDIMIAVKPCTYIPVKTEDDDAANKEPARSSALQDGRGNIDDMDISCASDSPGIQHDDSEKSNQQIEHLSSEDYGQVKRIKRHQQKSADAANVKVTLNGRSDSDRKELRKTMDSDVNEKDDDTKKNGKQVGKVLKMFRCKHCCRFFPCHPNIKCLVCDSCEKQVVGTSGASSDKDIVHLKNAPSQFKCKQCNKTYPSKLSNIGTNVCIECAKKPFVCEECFKTFSQESNLEKHFLDVHLSMDPVSCNHCGKEFAHKKYLKTHLVSKHGKEDAHFECGTCGLGCSSKSSFLQHIRTHSDEENQFLCDTCGMRFSNKQAMVSHANSHVEEN